MLWLQRHALVLSAPIWINHKCYICHQNLLRGLQVERERECVVIVGHQAVLRAVVGYFLAVPLEVRASN